MMLILCGITLLSAGVLGYYLRPLRSAIRQWYRTPGWTLVDVQRICEIAQRRGVATRGMYVNARGWDAVIALLVTERRHVHLMETDDGRTAVALNDWVVFKRKGLENDQFIFDGVDGTRLAVRLARGGASWELA